MNRAIVFMIALVVLLLGISVGLYAITPDTWSTGGQFSTGVTVTGRVVTSSQDPIQDVSVTAFTSTTTHSNLTNSTGHFSINLEPGEYDFSFVKQPEYYTQFKYKINVSEINDLAMLAITTLLPGNCEEDSCTVGGICDPRCYGSSECNVEYAQVCVNRQPGWKTKIPAEGGTTQEITCCSTAVTSTKTQKTEGKLTVCADDIVTRKIPTLYRGDPITIAIHTFEPENNCN